MSKFGTCSLLCILVLLAPNIAGSQEFTIDRNTLESWIFSSQGNAVNGRKSLNAQIELRISTIEQSVTLSEDQKQRILLAAKGDIKRFFDRVEQVVAQVNNMKLNQNNFNEAYQLTVPLQSMASGGIFNEDSLFTKVVRASMTAEQRDLLDATTRKRRQRDNLACVRSAIAALLPSIPLTADQRLQLEQRTIQNFPDRNHPPALANMIATLVLSEIPEPELATFLDENQILSFKEFRNQQGAIKAYLAQQGIIKSDDDAGTKDE